MRVDLDPAREDVKTMSVVRSDRAAMGSGSAEKSTQTRAPLTLTPALDVESIDTSKVLNLIQSRHADTADLHLQSILSLIHDSPPSEELLLDDRVDGVPILIENAVVVHGDLATQVTEADNIIFLDVVDLASVLFKEALPSVEVEGRPSGVGSARSQGW